MISVGGRRSSVVCHFCQKSLTKKEEELHIYVCEKVPQEIFGGTTNRSDHSLQNTLGR